MSYIVTNKWMRAGYGEPLRAFFAKESAIEQIIDFGHAPIFEDADVFPCIIVLEKPRVGSLTPQPPLPRRGEGEQEIADDRWEIAEPLHAKMIEVARQFRKQPTASEAILWQALRGKQLDGWKFRRQQPIGPFVVDFFCPSERLIVEVDGPIHDEQRDADRRRQELLESLGLRFVRVTAASVETNLDAVLASIRAALLPPLPGVGEGGRGGEGESLVHVVSFPREALKLVQLDGYVRKYGHPVPQARFTAAPWSLDASDVDDLMVKIKRAGLPLVEFAGKPFRGILTGLTEAFVIDAPTKEQIVRNDRGAV
jgi:very-short-patch-repair endonuclease